MITIDAYCVVGRDRETNLPPRSLLKLMDLARVDRTVIAPVDRHIAVNNREGNRFILGLVKANPSRFIASCTANPWFGKKAVAEFERAAGEGARLLNLHPFLHGCLADDELYWPLLEKAGLLQVPVYIHTGNPGNSTPWQLSGLAQRFPQVDFIMGHSGSTDFWNDVTPAAQSAPNLSIETSLARPFSVPGRVSALGKSKVIMGSYAPLQNLEFEWQQMRRELSEEAWPDVLGGNLLRLLEKRGSL